MDLTPEHIKGGEKPHLVEGLKKSRLGPLHTRHFCSRYCDKKIKRHFSSNIFWDNSKYFEISLQYFEEIFLSKYLFISLSKYCVQKCLVCISPKSELEIENFL